METTNTCVCLREQCRSDAFDSTEIGTERGDGMSHRFEIQRCRACGRYWLRYTLEHENSPAWNKWYRGEVSEEFVQEATPDTAAAAFKAMPRHFYGGPYYRSSGEEAYGPVHVGLPGRLADAA